MSRSSLLLAVAFVVLFVSTADASPYSDAVLADNPFVYYRFEENAGPTAVNSGSMGAAGDGTYVGPVTLGSTEVGAPIGLGNSVGFLGGGAQYIDVPNVGTHTQLTVEAWINADGVAGGCCTSIYSTDTFDGSGGASLHFNLKGGRDIEHALPGGAPQNVNTPGGAAPDNEWSHIVATFDGTNSGETKIYVDGTQLAVSNRGPTSIGLVDTGQIGAWNAGRLFPGHIDEFAFYDTVLTAEQVQAHFDAASQVGVVPEPASIAMWTLLAASMAGFGYFRHRRRK